MFCLRYFIVTLQAIIEIKMRLSNAILITLLPFSLASCFKEEPLNAECDIETAWVHVATPLDMFFQLSDTIKTVNTSVDSIGFDVRRQADLTQLAPTFTLTQGATIEPANGSAHDFSHGALTYTVTSEDGNWHRTYKVAFVPKTRTVNDTLVFDFEQYQLDTNSKYYTWGTDAVTGQQTDKWATGNPGFAIARSSAKPEDYPTTPLANGFRGAAVRLTTQDTGSFGTMSNMPLAAGNLFLGEFDVKYALKNALLATSFGVPFDKKPVKFIGYYRYKPGEAFQDRSKNIIAGRTDKANIYSVVYRNHDDDGNAVVLHGDNVLNSPLVVAIARLVDIEETDEWTRFELDYNYLSGDIDHDLLEEYGYSIAIVFTSSAEGANFEGAIGSTLDIDEVSVVCETTE